ncbi:MAG: pentapeptide repeat-containing protein [Cyanobacteria bacterium P01_A01_bin.80]
MNAEELLEKYKAGERTFKELNLRGLDFKGADLSGIDLESADLTEENEELRIKNVGMLRIQPNVFIRGEKEFLLNSSPLKN